MFQECCNISLQKIDEDPSSDVGWKLLFLLPRILLQPHVRGGKVGYKEVKARYQSFLNFRWDELIELNTPTNRKSENKSMTDENKRKAAVKLAQVGEISKAAKFLTSNGLAPETSEVLQKLKSKHPEGLINPNEIPDVLSSSSPTFLDRSVFINAIKNAPKASGCGPSGWRYEHVRILLDNDITTDLLFQTCNHIFSGDVPPNVVPLLSASKLIAIPKHGNDVRPIAVGEVFRRLTAKTICQQKSPEFASYFSPIQHGIATPGGAELLTHHIQILLEQNPDWSILKTDVRNAFNSVSRERLLQQIAKDFPDIYPHVKQLYMESSKLIYVTDKGVELLTSSEGVHQGDPLGPALFSATIHPILCEVIKRHEGVTMLAYLDDIYVVGPVNSLRNILDDLKSSLSTLHLEILDRKCELFCPSGNVCNFPTPVTSDGTIILGTPVGKPEFVRSQCADIAKGGKELCRELALLNNRQISMLILRHCHVPRLNYLARQVFPRDLELAAVIHDKMTRSSFVDIIGFNHLNDTAWKQATLKLKNGGFGLTQIGQISHAAFVSSWCQSMKELPSRFLCMTDLVDYLTSSKEKSGSIGSEVISSFSDLPPLSKSADNDEDFQTLDDIIAYPKKLQHRLCTEINEINVSELIAQAPSDKDAARLRSLQGRGAGDWLDAIPTSDRHALKTNDFSIASYLRLGLALPFTKWVKVCDCGQQLDQQGYHLLTCKYGGGPVWTHNTILKGWSECLSDLHIPHQTEPRHRFVSSENRPDMTLFDSETGQNLDVDVSLAHPWSKDALNHAHREEGYAAKVREEKKLKKYSGEVLHGGLSSKCVPLVFEHFGLWGSHAHKFLSHISRQSYNTTHAHPFNSAQRFKAFWRKQFSIILQRCNARVISRKLSRFSCSTNDSGIMFDCNVVGQVH